MTADRTTLIAHALQMLFRNQGETRLNTLNFLLTRLANEECRIGVRLHRQQSGTIGVNRLINAKLIAVEYNSFRKIYRIACEQ
ncbi:MAG: hypothetical protein CMK07_13050 [Ponticaulis sp.]|nr:hypothetical protein [Ponticaulis sp.]